MDSRGYQFSVVAASGETFDWLRGRAEKSGVEVTEATESTFSVAWRGSVISEPDPPAVVQIEVRSARNRSSLVIVTIAALGEGHLEILRDYAGPLGRSMSEITPTELAAATQTGRRSKRVKRANGKPFAAASEDGQGFAPASDELAGDEPADEQNFAPAGDEPADEQDSSPASEELLDGQGFAAASDEPASDEPADEQDFAHASDEPSELDEDAQGHPGLQHLGRVARKIANANVSQEEPIHDVIKGTSGQCMIALDDRLLIVKPPGVLAGLRSQTTAFPYRNISAFELNMGALSGAIEVIAPGYDGKHKTNRHAQFSRSDRNNRTPERISNCLPILRRDVKSQRTAIERVKERINAAQAVRTIAWTPPEAPAPPAAKEPRLLADELQKLAALRDQGILTPEEFDAQKRRLLDFGS
jgi:Short C-terminal domain